MPNSGLIQASRTPGGGPARRRPGPMLLLPGLPQGAWGQRDRATVFAGSYASALAAGLFAWGTVPGAILLGFAFAAHVASAADAIRQWAFPGFGRRAPAAMAAAALGLGIYGPLAVFGALVAWPGIEGRGGRSGYAIDRLAYHGRRPSPGDRVWLGSADGQHRGRLARVLARPGDEVAWASGRLEAAGRRYAITPFRPGQEPRRLAFTVPDGQLLVSYRTDDPLLPRAWEFIPEARVEGRAWARLYPVWERRLLN